MFEISIAQWQPSPLGPGTREKLPITPSRLKGSLTPWTAGWTSWTPRSYRFNQQLQQLCQQQQPLPAEFRSIETRLGDGFRYLSFPSTKLRFRVRGRLDVLVNPGPTRSKPFATICGKCAPYLGILGAWKNNAIQLCARIWSDDIVVPCCPSQHEIKDLANSRTSVEHDFHLHLQWNLVSMKIWLTTNRFTWCIGRTSFRPQRKCWVRGVRLMYQVCLQYFAVPCQCCAVLSVGAVTSVSMVIQHVSTTVTLINLSSMTSPKSKTLPHPGPKHLWWLTCHHNHDILMQKHATTMPMIQKEKALWPARTRTIHAAAMPSYSMQISAVFAKLSFKQHQTFVPSFQFWNNNCKSEPYLSESLIKTYQNMLRGLSASLKCVLDKLRQHSAPNNPRQRKHCVQHKLRLWQMCGLGLKTKSWEGPIPAGLQKNSKVSGTKKCQQHEHPSLANSARCWSRHPKLHETGWFFCWVILSTWWNVLWEKMQPDNWQSTAIKWACLLNATFTELEKTWKHDMEPIKLQSSCKVVAKNWHWGSIQVHVPVATE